MIRINAHRGLSYWAFVVFMLALIGKASGFIREVIYSYYYGVSAEFDAYTVAFTFTLFIGALCSSILYLAVPKLTQAYTHKDSTEFSTIFTSIVLIVAIPVVAVIGLGELFSDVVIELIAAGFKDSPSTFALASDLLRLMLPLTTLIAATHLLRSLLSLTGQFFLSNLESIAFNLGIVASVFAWVGIFGAANVYAPIAGIYVAYSLFLIVSCLSLKLPFELSWRYSGASLLQMANSGGWVFAGALLTYASPIILMWKASFLEPGAVSAMGYVSRMLVFAIGVFVASLMTVFLPSASKLINEGAFDRLSNQMEKMLKVSLGLGFATCALILVKGDVLMQLLYGRGQVSNTDVYILSQLLLYYLPWVVFFPISAIAIRILYAYQQYKVIALISAISLVLVIMLAPLARSWLGLNGLGLSSSLHMMAYAGLLIYFASKGEININKKDVAMFSAKYLAALFGVSFICVSVLSDMEISEMLKLCIFAGAVSVLFLYFVNKVVPLKQIIGLGKRG
jgi:putative peptidoglycan lipid II flippase